MTISGGSAPRGAFNIPFIPIAIVVVLLVIIAATFAFCHGNNEPEQAVEVEQVEEVQQEAETLNPDIPEELRWRDEDFKVDPTRTSWTTKDNGRKVVYLTIDDGPSALTEKYLDLFDQYNVKATFFVTAQDPEYFPVIHEAYKRGHTIGLHSYTHEYSEIYSSQDAFFKDLDKIGQVVQEQIGYVPCFIRFPGGSSNTISADYSEGIMTKLTKAVVAEGYQYYDWNLDTGDGAGYDKDAIIASATMADLEGELDENGEVIPVEYEDNLMLLCHDTATKQDTLDALPAIIEFYQGKGYSFEAMDRDTWVCHQEVNN